MAVDPKNMQAWLKGGNGEPDDMGDEEAPDEAEGQEEKQAEGDIEDRYPTLFPLLEEYGTEVEEAAQAVDFDQMDTQDELDEDNHQLLVQSIDMLPEELRDALTTEGKDLDRNVSGEMADALLAGDHITDADMVAGFLFHASRT